MRKRYICVHPAYGRVFYRSNCLIEALAAKFNDWDNIKIIYISPRINDCHLPHFMWYDKIDGNIYDFVGEKENTKNFLFPLGYIKLRTLKGFLNWIENKKGGVDC